MDDSVEGDGRQCGSEEVYFLTTIAKHKVYTYA